MNSSQTAYNILKQSWDPDKLELIEQFKVLLLNRAGRVLGIYELATGGLTGTVVDTRLILTAALKSAACTIILAHNHPSGETRPSKADELMTEKIRQASDLLDIKLADHLILTCDAYLSFADERLL